MLDRLHVIKTPSLNAVQMYEQKYLLFLSFLRHVSNKTDTRWQCRNSFQKKQFYKNIHGRVHCALYLLGKKEN